MVKETIQIYARLKPCKQRPGIIKVDHDGKGGSVVQFMNPRESGDGYVNNKKELYNFKFQHVFTEDARQDDIFNQVAKPVVNSVLAGYNGTIFAYGQTGSGKTFTITGGAEKYADRGIIPRTLSYIFEEFNKQTSINFTVHVSYLEIYNEIGYDLLDPKHVASKMEDLPKVTLLEDPDQRIHLKNLSVQLVSNEEEALNFLFIGDTNRMIAETPMNQASTRSHCIFTIHLTARHIGSSSIHRSKLHLVDLAGSERVSKSGVNGLLLTEAKYINLSLHYLEQVIVALSEKNRSHIPYRNSMMTSVLRDSLGGNCMTSMIATCAIDRNNIDESISTCRFAQRVALISNEAVLNVEEDPKLIIERLKKQVYQLRWELKSKNTDCNKALTDEELEECEQLVKEYLSYPEDSVIADLSDLRKIRKCFDIFKKLIIKLKEQTDSESQSIATFPSDPQDLDVSPYYSAAERKLKDLVKQRDCEINILVGMLQIEKRKNIQIEHYIHSLNESGTIPLPALLKPNSLYLEDSDENSNADSARCSLTCYKSDEIDQQNIPPNNANPEKWLQPSDNLAKSEQNINPDSASSKKYIHTIDNLTKIKLDTIPVSTGSEKWLHLSDNLTESKKDTDPNTNSCSEISQSCINLQTNKDDSEITNHPGTWLHLSNDLQRSKSDNMHRNILSGTMSLGRQEAFDIFCHDYKFNNIIKLKKTELKKQYSRAKSLGEEVNMSRIHINELKSQMEQHRIKCEQQGTLNPNIPDAEEERLKNKLEKERSSYKKNFHSLRDLKHEIEHCQHLLEKEKVQLMKAFEEWWAEQVNLVTQKQHEEQELQRQQQQQQQQQQRLQLQQEADNFSNHERYPGMSDGSRSPDSSACTLNSDLSARRELPRRQSTSPLFIPSASHPTSSQQLAPIDRRCSAPMTDSRSTNGDIPLTGDSKVDADIQAFVKARKKLIQKRSENKKKLNSKDEAVTNILMNI
ncbi:kinesin-like protein KIF6 [Argonauta hians]